MQEVSPSPHNGRVMLEAVGLSKRYEDGILALDGVSFQVRAGQIYAMLGANGAGKTTTINLFLNFIEPTSGEARIDGIVCHADPLEAKQRVAFVSEQVRLYPGFTALENLHYFSRLGGKTGYCDDDYRSVLLRVGLPQEAHRRKLRDFSKGMLQKCGIAIAILKDASAILLDEPTAGLDPKAGHEFVRLLGTLRDEGKAVLMSTHDIFRAKEVADVIGFMKAGRLVMQRSRQEIAGADLEQLYIQYVAAHDGAAGEGTAP